MKRFASHYLFLPEHGWMKQMVVEIENDNVSRIFPLSEESERVQWMPGVSVLLSDTDVTKDFDREAMLADKIRPLLAETKIVDYIASDMNEVIMQKKWVVFRLFPFDFIDMQPYSATKLAILR
jgi:hypothetical protein